MIDREGRGGEEEERRRKKRRRRGGEGREERRKGQRIRVLGLVLVLVLDRIRGVQRVQSSRAGVGAG